VVVSPPVPAGGVVVSPPVPAGGVVVSPPLDDSCAGLFELELPLFELELPLSDEPVELEPPSPSLL
jgi:hypothetical protein